MDIWGMIIIFKKELRHVLPIWGSVNPSQAILETSLLSWCRLCYSYCVVADRGQSTQYPVSWHLCGSATVIWLTAHLHFTIKKSLSLIHSYSVNLFHLHQSTIYGQMIRQMIYPCIYCTWNNIKIRVSSLSTHIHIDKSRLRIARRKKQPMQL